MAGYINISQWPCVWFIYESQFSHLSPRGEECFKTPMMNETLIMNFAGEQEALSLSIWAQYKLDGRRRQAKEIRVTGPVVVEERDLEV